MLYLGTNTSNFGCCLFFPLLKLAAKMRLALAGSVLDQCLDIRNELSKIELELLGDTDLNILRV
jgi:hypothetical protein